MTDDTTERDRGYAMSQLEVAQALGVTRAAVYFAERRALEKLRRMMAERGMTAADFYDVEDRRCD